MPSRSPVVVKALFLERLFSLLPVPLPFAPNPAVSLFVLKFTYFSSFRLLFGFHRCLWQLLLDCICILSLNRYHHKWRRSLGFLQCDFLSVCSSHLKEMCGCERLIVWDSFTALMRSACVQYATHLLLLSWSWRSLFWMSAGVQWSIFNKDRVTEQRVMSAGLFLLIKDRNLFFVYVLFNMSLCMSPSFSKHSATILVYIRKQVCTMSASFCQFVTSVMMTPSTHIFTVDALFI